MAVRSRWSALTRGGAAGLLAVLVGAATGAQSPSVVPAASPVAGQGPAVTTPLTVTWTTVEALSDPQAGASAAGLGMLPDGRLALLGGTLDDPRDPDVTAAAWATSDGETWTSLKLKARPLSLAFAIGAIDETTVITGMDPDGAGAAWVQKGDRFGAPKDIDGLVVALLGDGDALLGAGMDPTGAPAVLRTTDGRAWTATQLAPSGRALAIVRSATSELVVAGATATPDGLLEPVVWTSLDGATWTAVPLGGAPGRWSAPVLLATTAGLVLAFNESTDAGAVARLYTSTDGATWQEAGLDPGGALRAGVVVGGQALLIGDDRIVNGVPGDTWRSTPDATLAGWQPRAAALLPDGRVVVAADRDDMLLHWVRSVWVGTVTP